MDLNIAYTGMEIGQQQVQELVVECAPSVNAQLMASLVKRESNYSQYAIGMDAGYGYVKQPSTLDEAKKTVKKLLSENKKFSIGLAQIHISNVERYQLTLEQAFTPCINLHTGELIYNDFYNKAIKHGYKDEDAVFAALRGYNSGNINKEVSNEYATAIMSFADFKVSKLSKGNESNIKLASNDEGNLTNKNDKGEALNDFFGSNRERQNDFFSSRENHNGDIFN